MFDKDSNPKDQNLSRRLCDIAVVGLSGRFPGGANSPAQLWEFLVEGRDAVGEAAGDRWDLGWHNANAERNDRVYTRSCGLLDQIDGFDADFFGISPREAKQMDPQQRLLLELAWEAFDDAGIPPRSTAGTNTGVYVGISSNDYSQLDGESMPDAYSNTGVSFSIAANRLSYVFDLHGPSIALDTACSSSLVCIHQACRAIRNGECDAALAGGVSVLSHIRPWLGFARASMLSPDGRCKSFDASGNGYVRSEGGALVLLKRLEDAERDGDNILGVIRASGINSDGRTMGLSMPSSDAQADLLVDLYGEAGIAPEDVFYVEAHGTGTSVGDPLECAAIGKVLGTPREDGSRCHIGSVKSNIGHLEPASGVAGLSKVLLALKHRMIPANLHFDTPNPKIAFDDWKLSVVDQPIALPEHPVTIGVNSFGFGGTNSHVIVKEYRRSDAPIRLPAPAHLILSANSEAALRSLASQYAALLRAPDADYATIAHAAGACRSPLRMRLVVAADSAGDAAAKLDAWLDASAQPGTATGSAEKPQIPTAFVYSGNGPQWWGMGRELLATNATFRARIEAVDAIFAPLAGWSILAEMAKPEADVAIAKTEIAQPLLFAQQMGLTAIFREAGITPAAVLGHSVGEVAAACASGALSLEQATQVIYHRSHEQAKTAGIGKMAALGLDPEAAKAAIAKIGGWLEIAAINGPAAVTVAGDESCLARLADHVTESGKFARVLQLDYPFHTSAMDPIRDSLLTSLADLQPADSAHPFISTVHGEMIDGPRLDAGYWFDNIRKPVNFHGAISHCLSEHGIGLFIEMGPHPVLKDYIAQTARAAGAVVNALETLRRPGKDREESDTANLATAIAASLAHGACDPAAIYTRPSRMPALPSYPWQRERHWRGGVVLPDGPARITRDHPLLGVSIPSNDGTWEMAMDKVLLSYLADHVVQDSVLFPAAGYVEMMLAAARLKWGEDRVIDLETVQILRPLVLGDQNDPIVQTLVDSRDNSVTISSRRDRSSRDFQVHLRGRLSPLDDIAAQPVDVAALMRRLPVEIDAAKHYGDSAQRGLQYGPLFQGIQSVRLSPADAQQREGLGIVRLDFLKEGGLEAYRAHPSLFDSCLQTIIALVCQNDKRDISTIPVAFDRVRSFRPIPPEVLCHVAISRESDRSVVATFTLMTPDGEVVMQMDGARCQKANLTGKVTSPLTSEWWRPDTVVVKSHGLPALPNPAELEPAPVMVADIGATLDKLASMYAMRAIDALLENETSFTLASLARRARIKRAQGALLAQVLDMAEETGLLTRDGQSYTRAAGELPLVDALWAEAFRNNPSHQAELLLIAQQGDALLARLRGADDTPSDAALLEQLHDTAPFAAETNQLALTGLAALVAQWPEDRPMRILELGGGTGGLTSWLLPILPAERADYLFTDTSEAHVAKVERRLGAHKFLRSATIDPGRALADQGLALGYFDLVICSGQALGTAQGAVMLEELQTVMAEGAKLMALVPRTGAAASLLLGTAAPLDADILQDAGFADVSRFSLGRAALYLGTATRSAPTATPEITPTSLLIVAENPVGFAQSLQAELQGAGHAVTLTGFPAQAEGEAAIKTLRDALAASHAQNVVLLGDAQPRACLHHAQTRRALTAVALTAAMELTRQDRDCSLSIVTRGAFPTANGAAPRDPAEAALWGLGRVIGNEHSGLEPRLIDLHDPEDAATLAAELARRDAETEVQLCGGHRYVNRERLTTLADEARHAGLTATDYALDFVPQGGLDSLHLRELTRNAPQGDQIEIAVKAAGLNFRDVLWCMGMLPEEAVEHGFSGPTIGMECAGIVTRVGPEVTHVSPGDRVMAFASSCFATHVTTAAKSVMRMHDTITFAQAATVPTVFLTAWYGLDYLARLEPGETILIHGAAGGVGLAAIQIAKQKGAIVIGTAGSPMKRRMLALLGVDHVLDSRSLAYADKVMDITGGKGVDVILNSLAGEAILKNLNILKPFGRFLEIGKRDLYDNSRIGLRPFRNNLSYFGIDADTLLIERPALAQRLFEQVIAQFSAGTLKPLPHQVIPISRASEAFRAMQGSRHVGKLVVSLELDRPEDLYVVRQSSQVRPGGTYLVTGGLGGFGLATAKWLVAQGADALALVSRSGATRDEAKAAIAEFESAGIQVRSFAADIADPAQVAQIVATIRTEMPPLIGIIHSAAVIEDAPIQNIEAGQLARVFLPKMMGAWNLHQATLDDPLETFVFYSSSSAVVGNPGQGAYVAANLYLDALAMLRRAQGRPALAIGWGAIRDVGFLTRHENVRDMLKTRTGLDATPAGEALEDLGRTLAAGSSRVSVARFDLQRLHQMLPAARVPRFLPIVPSDATAMLQADETLADLLAGMPEAEQRGFILERIVEIAARVLGTNASQINPQQALGDLGLDSLMAVELAGSLERDVGQSIPVMQLLGADSLIAVAEYVAKLLGVNADEGSTPDAPEQSDRNAA
ncbi:MAG: SDR family NAD(P)-dependent oxidoreductase [Rhodobacteraceae bacterium]|nr:MAG: SDR family NAD(P)-dependent oxidoreductase [Paracoccaceae bacterium]